MEKKNNKIALFVILGFLAVGLIVAVSVLITTLQKDPEGFAADMQAVCDQYDITGVELEKGNIYKLSVYDETWRTMTNKQAYCTAVYIRTRTAIWDNKMMREPNLPIVEFYVGNTLVADVSADKLRIK